jgi:hypothetical protein
LITNRQGNRGSAGNNARQREQLFYHTVVEIVFSTMLKTQLLHHKKSEHNDRGKNSPHGDGVKNFSQENTTRPWVNPFVA